jgi:transmembrane sensor
MGRDQGDEPVRTRRRWAVPAALAATVLVAVIGVRFGMQLLERSAQSAAYTNVSVEQKSIVLSDGSVVHLDVDSRISVHMTPEQRRVELLSGRALFAVTHDANRPFSVFAGATSTRALGTHFQVARKNDNVEVTLAEGSIVVASTNVAHGWEERLTPGEQLDISSDSSSHARRLVDPLVATSWSRGRLVFRGTPLAEAVDEVNLYATKKVHLGDPNLASLSISGNVVAGSGELAASAFAAVLPVHVVDGGGEIIIFPGRADDPR